MLKNLLIIEELLGGLLGGLLEGYQIIIGGLLEDY